MDSRVRNRLYVAVACLALQGGVSFGPALIPAGIVAPAEHKLEVVIVHEATGTASKLESLYRDLRTGDAFKSYTASKGHVLRIYDKDVRDENGDLVVPEADYAGKSLPVVICYDQKTGKVVSATPLPRDGTATVETVTQIVRSAGG
jgi:hypothetical protein